jgi:hypothetical protein
LDGLVKGELYAEHADQSEDHQQRQMLSPHARLAPPKGCHQRREHQEAEADAHLGELGGRHAPAERRLRERSRDAPE